jgi:hypothetical protein
VKKILLYATLAISIFAIFTTTSKFVIADEGCKLSGTNHDDNNPSKHKFFEVAYHGSLCEIAQCVDNEKCDNHTKVDWDKFQGSPAFKNAEDDEQKALIKWHKDGNGMDGLGGYEMLKIVQKDY